MTPGWKLKKEEGAAKAKGCQPEALGLKAVGIPRQPGKVPRREHGGMNGWGLSGRGVLVEQQRTGI